nr:hypothetical protein [Variovorax boronicumulans]
MHKLQGPEMGAPGEAVAAATQAHKQITQTSILGDPAERLKALLLERAARAGVTVHESFGGYVVRCGSLRELPDLRALSMCLSSMGVHA